MSIGTTDNNVVNILSNNIVVGQYSTISYTLFVPNILGPTNSILNIIAASPSALASAVSGNSILIQASPATAGLSGSSSAVGGSVNIIGGNGAPNTNGNGTGGSINLTPGSGSNIGTGGSVNINNGVGAGVNGSINITTNSQTSGGSSGNIVNTIGRTDNGNAGGFIVKGSTPSVGSVLSNGSFIQLSTSAGRDQSSGVNSSIGGYIIISLGKGGDNTSPGVTGNAGNAGTFSIIGGTGGAASGTGLKNGGNGSNIIITSGVGGNSTNGTGGTGGNIILQASAGGTGSSSNGITGSISFNIGNNTKMNLSSNGNLLVGTSSDNNNGSLQVSGNISLETVGNSFNIKGGTNASVGTASLVGGTVTVNNTSVNSNKLIFLSVQTDGGTVGNLSYTINTGVSFTINSSNVLDTSLVNWWIIGVI